MSTTEHDTYTALVNPTPDLWQALLRVQGATSGAKRDAKNPHFRNNYATLESVWQTLRKPLQDAGLVVVQAPAGLVDGHVQLTTTIAHAKTGAALVNTISMPCPKPDPQGVGSAVTYASRYALMALFGLPPTDDDGEAARVDNPREVERRAPDGEVVPSLEAAVDACADSITAIKDALREGDTVYAKQCWDELSQAHKMALWVAPSKGGPFTTAERTAIKELKAAA